MHLFLNITRLCEKFCTKIILYYYFCKNACNLNISNFQHFKKTPKDNMN